MILFTQFNAYFGECPHEDVYVIGVHSGVLADSTTRSTQCSDRMRLIHVDVRLVLLADSMRRLKKASMVTDMVAARKRVILMEKCLPDNFLQVADASLHAINALYHDNNLLPRSVVPGLSVADSLSEYLI